MSGEMDVDQRHNNTSDSEAGNDSSEVSLCSLNINAEDGSCFHIDPFTVHQTLCIPYGGLKVPLNRNYGAKEIISRDTGQGVQGAKIDDLIALVNEQLDGDKFSRIFMLIALSVFLCPSSNTRISPIYNSAITRVSDICKYDWCTVVSDFLHSKLKALKESIVNKNESGTASLGGCIFVLLAAFFDYIILPQQTVGDALPRLIVWNDATVKSYESAIRNNNQLKVRLIRSMQKQSGRY